MTYAHAFDDLCLLHVSNLGDNVCKGMLAHTVALALTSKLDRTAACIIFINVRMLSTTRPSEALAKMIIGRRTQYGQGAASVPRSEDSVAAWHGR